MVMLGIFGTRVITIAVSTIFIICTMIESYLDPSIVTGALCVWGILIGAFVFALGGREATASSGIFCLLDLRSEELGCATVASCLAPAEAFRLRGRGRGASCRVVEESLGSWVVFVAVGGADVWATWLAA